MRCVPSRHRAPCPSNPGVRSEPWYADARALDAAVAPVRAAQPGLVLLTKEGPPRLHGEFVLRDGGRTLERFAIEVRFGADSARALPEVREIGGRIPRDPDLHVNTDGTLCVVQPAWFWFTHPEGLELAAFLEGPLRAYLASQIIVAAGGEWPNGEWAHGATGVFDCFTAIFGVSSPGVVLAFAGIIAGQEASDGSRCPCGSGRRFRKCHGPIVFKVRRSLPPNVRRDSYNMLVSAPQTRGLRASH